MILSWALALIRRRAGRLATAAFGIAVAVALTASLGSFLAASRATMTTRATAGVAVDWQVAIGSDGSGDGLDRVLQALRRDPGTLAALPVGFADSPGFVATTQGTTQTTGSGQVLGLPPGYQHTFAGELRLLTGSLTGPLLAQQTAANLHAQPGDVVRVRRAGAAPVRVTVAGIVELPLADSLFQHVGAPPLSQPVAPPDNVLLLPGATFNAAFQHLPGAQGTGAITTQVHVRRSHQLPADPAAAFAAETKAAKHLEVTTSGAAVVGDNLGAVLDAAREDASYAQVLFLFLAAPGVALAAALTAAVAQAGAPRRRREQALLRRRGSTTGQLLRLTMVEAALVSILGGAAGLLAAAVIGRVSFGAWRFGASSSASLFWALFSMALGLVIVSLVVVLPARRELRRGTTAMDSARPPWLRYGLDVILLALALGVFWAAGRNNYQLVLVPEGVPTLSVSYWAFLAPGLAWVGAGLLGWRLADLLLGPGRPVLSLLLRPVAGELAPTGAAMMSRQRRIIARSAVLVGLALAFAVSTATFNATYRQQAEADAQLTNGADVTVTEPPGVIAPADLATRIRQVPGVRHVEPMLHRFAYVGTDLQDLYGINPTTIGAATTLQDPYFQGATAGELLRRLAARPDAVLVSAETVNDYQLNLGDLLRLRLQDSRTRSYATITFHYVGIVNEFPTAPKDSFIVANLDYVARQTGSAAAGTYLVDTGGSNVGSTAAAVRRLVATSATVTTIDEARGLVGSSLTSVDLSGLTRIELAFAVVIAAAAGGLVVALGLNERRRSIAIAALIGARRRQLAGLSVGEPGFVILVGTAIGLLTGWGLAYLLVKVLTGVFDPPPASLSFPWWYLAVVVGVTAAAIAFAAAHVASRSVGRGREYLHDG